MSSKIQFVFVYNTSLHSKATDPPGTTVSNPSSDTEQFAASDSDGELATATITRVTGTTTRAAEPYIIQQIRKGNQQQQYNIHSQSPFKQTHLTKSADMAAVVRKKQDDKYLQVLRELVTNGGGNRQCFDCGQKGPTYVNMTIGSFVCTRCSGVL
ncbi:uncharacterized protein LOC129248806 [Anastrepha obliqua]|uniref:uncharacterized protein LOC129248806 n=1 Tax=Anastrepha obliqua TaxID=95512 RepID=UPI002409B0A2|nr:uncharacterized protein LOC129248806 [Anastrepha obliqua]